MSEENTPLISKTAFGCPHCGAYTTQNWFQLSADPYSEEHRTPTIPDEAMAEDLKTAKDIPEEARNELVKWVQDMLSGRPFFEKTKNTHYNCPTVQNCNISRCYSCKELAV